jgi:hypothetical protein
MKKVILSVILLFTFVFSIGANNKEVFKVEKEKTIKEVVKTESPISNLNSKPIEYADACNKFAVSVFVSAFLDEGMSLEDSVDIANKARNVCEALVLIGSNI